MAQKPKLRVVATIDGQTVELFNVEENSRGHLIVGARTKIAYVDGEELEVIDRHVSVHENSNNASITNISFKTLLKDGSVHNVVTLLNDSSEELLWPLFAHRVGVCPEKFEKAYIIRSKDREMKIGEYVSARENLLYACYVIRPGAMIDLPESWNCHRQEFKQFSLLILSTYLPVPSHRQGHFTLNATALPIRVKDDRSPFYIERNSPRMSELVPMNMDLLRRLKNRFIELVASGMDAETFKKLDEATCFTTAVPLSKLIDLGLLPGSADEPSAVREAKLRARYEEIRMRDELSSLDRAVLSEVERLRPQDGGAG